MKSQIEEKFGNHLRLRPCGILIHENKILLIRHSALNESGIFWSPPGGGLSFGENIDTCLQREFIEETGLNVQVGDFIGVYEYIAIPLHAVELFYACHTDDFSRLKLGTDPELDSKNQIIQEFRWFDVDELKQLPLQSIHPALHLVSNFDQLNTMKGRLNFCQ